MRTLTTLLGFAGILSISGCGDYRPTSDVPGHLQPGSLSSVTAQAHQGDGANDSIEHMAKVPLGGYLAPNVPVLDDAQIAFCWFKRRESLDGESLRWDHWVAVKVREASFSATNLDNDAMYLDSLDDVVIDKDGQVHGRILGNVTRPSGTPVNASVSSGPWVKPGSGTTQVTVVEDDGRQPPRVVGSTNVPNNGVGGGAADQARVQNMIEQVQSSLRNQGVTPPPAPSEATLPPSNELRK